MAKYLSLKHYRRGPPPLDEPDGPVDPGRGHAYMQFRQEFADRLQASGEYIDGQPLESPASRGVP